MLLFRLTSKNFKINLNSLLNKSSKQILIRSLATGQIKYETETKKLIRLRREHEAKEEKTTGFDKMIYFNEHHLQIMKKHDTPEINRKRDKRMAFLIFALVAGASISAIPLILFYWYILWICDIEFIENNRDYWIDGWGPFETFKKE